MKRIATILLLALSGCTIIGHKPAPVGWPELKITEHHVTMQAMRNQCAQYAPWWGSIEGCAEINFKTKTCDLWFNADFPVQRRVIEHEYLHCQGHDHPGSTVLSDYFERNR